MSRSRSVSAAQAPPAGLPGVSEPPLQVKVLRLARPVPQTVLDARNVEAPSLPTAELLLPKAQHAVYVGEEFQCLLAVQQHGDVDEDSASITAEAIAPHGERLELLSARVSGTEFVRLVAFDAADQGVYTLAVTVRFEQGLEHKAFRRLFKFEAAPAISVRMKVSRGSAALAAHVLEAQIENMSDAALTVESCALSPAHDWQVTRLEPVQAEANVVLRPRDVHQWCFVLRGGRQTEVGNLSVGWRREPLGAKGWQTTGTIRV